MHITSNIQYCLMTYCLGCLGAGVLTTDVSTKGNNTPCNTTVWINESVNIGHIVCEMATEGFQCFRITAGDEFNRFGYDSTLGLVQVTGLLDFNISSEYRLTFNATNVDECSNSSVYEELKLTIFLHDEDDWPPIFNSKCSLPARHPALERYICIR
ncbi:cadherin-23-like [Ptychodera flava]|uniref:cadherin-23-like n=1 Tax=Ptychodera flava TaxID=63121 RepID=UPI00396A6724